MSFPHARGSVKDGSRAETSPGAGEKQGLNLEDSGLFVI